MQAHERFRSFLHRDVVREAEPKPKPRPQPPPQGGPKRPNPGGFPGGGGGGGGFNGGGFNFNAGAGQRQQRQQSQQRWQQQRQQQWQQQQPRQRPPPPKKRRDYYAILNLKRDATDRQVKKAYHAMARKWHPDKNRAPGQEERLEKAERYFKLIARAYEVLSDKDTRAAYDDGVDVDDSKWQQGHNQRREREEARKNVRFQGGADGNFRQRW